MSTPPGWRHLRVAGLELDVPTELALSREQGIEGPGAVFEGSGLRLIVDRSLFADPLTGYQSKTGYQRRLETVGGEPAEVMSFVDDDGNTTMATRLRGPITVLVLVAPEGDPDVARQILGTIQPVTGESDD